MTPSSLMWTISIASIICLSSLLSTNAASLIVTRQSSGTRTVGPLTWNADYFSIEGQPINIIAAEMHHFRTPIPELWRDPMEKIKAAGFNALSVYTHWGNVMPGSDPSTVSLSAPANDLARFFQIAKEVGLFVIYRPGPYINSEANGGGMPGWVQNLNSPLRVDTAVWNAAWQPYMKAVVKAAVPFQAKLTANGKLDTSGGTIIAFNVENEFQQGDVPGGYSRSAYFDKIIDFMHDNGVTVPTLHNALQGNADYASSTKLDLWGEDSYPNGFDCTDSRWSQALEYYNTLRNKRGSNPRSIPEFQGGSFPTLGGANQDACNLQLNQSFAKVYHKDAAGQEVRFTNQYMTFGGTNFGNLAFLPFGGSSYDYTGGLDEMRRKTSRLMQDKLLHNFMASFPEWASNKIMVRAQNYGVSQQNNNVFMASSQSTVPGVKTKWYITRQGDMTSNAITTFKLTIDSDSGRMTIPRNGMMRLEGRDAAIVTVDKVLSASGATLTYSTADIAFVGAIDGRDVIMAYGNDGQSYEMQIVGQGISAGYSRDAQTSSPSANTLIITWKPSQYSQAVQIVKLGNGKQILLLLQSTAFAYFTQPFSTATAGSLNSIVNMGDRILISGLYHIGSAKIAGDTLVMTGQTNVTCWFDAVVPASVKKMTFNGIIIGDARLSDYGTLVGTAPGPSPAALNWNPPALTGWKKADSLPEIQSDFIQDANWIKADKTSSFNPFFAQTSTNGVVLFADAYGFHASGNIIWQGRFTLGSTSPTALFLKLQGGRFFGASIFLNNVNIGSLGTDWYVGISEGTLNFPSGSIKSGVNVITIVMDDVGHEEVGFVSANDKGLPWEQTKYPRGILAYSLITAQPSVSWTVTGNQGGETLYDKTRGPLNEGGLYGERMGWHLPDFDDSKWSSGTPMQGDDKAGVSWYRTSFTLDVPKDHDLPIVFAFGGQPSQDASQDYRVLLFINGWQYGKRLARWGPQLEFPVPPGVLDPRGKNQISLAVWSLAKGAKIPSLEIKVKSRYFGDVPYKVNNPTWQQVRGSIPTTPITPPKPYPNNAVCDIEPF